jgi:DNA-binding Lrp family transcriptional regulator
VEDCSVPTAFVLLNTNVGSEFDVLRELRKVKGIQEASALYGIYDIIAQVKSESMESLRRTITWDIRKMDSVSATLTMMVHERGDVTDEKEPPTIFGTT